MQPVSKKPVAKTLVGSVVIVNFMELILKYDSRNISFT